MGRKRDARQLTPVELEIMKVLWETGPATVLAVQCRLPRPLAYTSVQTMLNVLHRKGKVKRVRKDADRAYEYQAVVSREKAVRVALRDVIDRLFGGSAESLVMSLVEGRHLAPEKLAELHRLISQSQAAEAKQEARDADP